METPSTFSAISSGVTSEKLALIGVCARLGTCVNNDNSNGLGEKSVRDEAMLLMNLLKGRRALEILSDHVESRPSPLCKRKSELLDCDAQADGSFTFTSPSLSLEADAQADAHEATTFQRSPSSSGDYTGEGSDKLLSPSALLSRPQCNRDKDGIRGSGESMAGNFLRSFGAALEWRAKTWIKSLATVLALRQQQRIDAPNAPSRSQQQFAGSNSKNENEDLMSSREMQIIDAIVKSSEEVSIVNIKTTFRVLQASVNDSYSESPKKVVKRESHGTTSQYTVTHKLSFEATISMTSNDGVRYNGIEIKAPGFIQGNFLRDYGSVTAEESLSSVNITLDTNVLADALERQSRLVVRNAAESTLVATGTTINGKPPRSDSPRVHHSVISPRYVLMSPMHKSHFTTIANDKARLPQVPSVSALAGAYDCPMDGATTVSSSSHGSCSSDSSANTTPSLAPVKNSQSPSFPALLSVANEHLGGTC